MVPIKNSASGTAFIFHDKPERTPYQNTNKVSYIKEYRNQHLGNEIMKIAEAEILKENGKQIEVSAQVRIKDFYNKLGYKEFGEVYFDEYCEHIAMKKELK